MQRRSVLQLAVAGALASGFALPAVAQQGHRPRRLTPGDTVALVAPASVTYESLELQLALETLEAMGLKARIGDHVMDRFGYLAGKDEDRAADINAAFADPRIDAVFALRGGWGVSRILP